MKNNLLPLDLQYLFRNEYLDSVKMLIILYQSKRRIKGIDLEELNYYFTIIELLEINEMHKYELNLEYSQDNYLINENVLRSYGIPLKNQDFISIYSENTNKKAILYFKLTDEGKRLIEGLEDEYFKTIIDRYNFVNNTMKYSVENQRKVLKGNEK